MNRRGQSVLYAVLLMPTLFLIFALAIDIGELQLDRLRLRYALDLATVSAATAADANLYSRTGQLRFDDEAAVALTREYLVRNLGILRDTEQVTDMAAAAEIRVLNQLPARDPYSGRVLDRPAIAARLRASHQFNLLAWIGIRRADITVTASSEIRR